MAENTADSARQLVDRLVNDAQFRDSVTAAPTAHDRAQLIRAAGYGDLSLDAIREAAKEQAAALGAGVQVDPARVKRVEELFLKAATDQELQQALQAAATPEAKRDVLAQAGYGDLTLDDLRAAAADLAQREELSDEELDLVAGGASQAEALWGVGTFAGLGLAGAGIGFVVAGPAGALVGAIAGLCAGAPIAIASVTLDVPPPSDW
jgi:predicted ribosomally synthesized peptide with nif11-like leader